jgi:hypothetical protein
MKDEKKNIKEPYAPESTPNPPQIIDPSRQNEQGERDQPLKTQPTNHDGEHKNNNKPAPKKKLLGESEIEIDDETTI